jgi:hypothetical protein
VFTARYALSPYIKQTRLVFKGLIQCFSIGGTRRVVPWYATSFGKYIVFHYSVSEMLMEFLK